MKPNAELMQQYGTEDVYLAKEAEGTAPLALRMAAAVLAMGTINRIQRFLADTQHQSFERNRLARNYDLGMMRRTVAGPARQSQAPVLVAPMLPGGSFGNVGAFPGMPVGMDTGMVRLAAAVGADLAKEATMVLPRIKDVARPRVKAPKAPAPAPMPKTQQSRPAPAAVAPTGGVPAAPVPKPATATFGTSPSQGQAATRTSALSLPSAPVSISDVRAPSTAARPSTDAAPAAQGSVQPPNTYQPKGRLEDLRLRLSPTARMRAAYAGQALPEQGLRGVFKTPTQRFIEQGQALGVITSPPPPPKTPAPAPSSAAPAGSLVAAPPAAVAEVAQAPQPAVAAPASGGGAPPPNAPPPPPPAAGEGGAPEQPGGVARFLDRSFGTPQATARTLGRLALVGAGGYMASKALRGGARVMSEENAPPDWGQAAYGAPQLPYGVNQYGYAQRNTPFMY